MLCLPPQPCTKASCWTPVGILSLPKEGFSLITKITLHLNIILVLVIYESEIKS